MRRLAIRVAASVTLTLMLLGGCATTSPPPSTVYRCEVGDQIRWQTIDQDAADGLACAGKVSANPRLDWLLWRYHNSYEKPAVVMR